jgi:phosphatidate cytidylyltransferase
VVIATAWRLPPESFIFLFLATATCDGFSQVVGQWLGRRRLAPRLSPGKTVAGLAGGLIAVSVVAVLMRDFIHTGPASAAALGVLAGLTGLAGDLGASWVKRRARIKDFSKALPGQGGFLDRFDSLLGALALAGPVLMATG